jgi:hypothetical protein
VGLQNEALRDMADRCHAGRSGTDHQESLMLLRRQATFLGPLLAECMELPQREAELCKRLIRWRRGAGSGCSTSSTM